MDIWDEIKKLSGYQSGNGGVDSYGVDHSGFSTRDELEYQSARLARENQLAEGFAKQGIAEENYPQFGTNFWGGTPENNYGFGTSNIKQNIEKVTNQLNNGGSFGGNTNNETNANFGANPSFATAPNSAALSTAQNQTPTSWSYNEPSTTPTPWSTTIATPTLWSNNATNVQSSSTLQNVCNYNNINALKQAQVL
jgi:hypothetical protein